MKKYIIEIILISIIFLMIGLCLGKFITDLTYNDRINEYKQAIKNINIEYFNLIDEMKECQKLN